MFKVLDKKFKIISKSLINCYKIDSNIYKRVNTLSHNPINGQIRYSSTTSGSDQTSDSFEERPQFPGSRSEWTQELKFIEPNSYEGIPVFRVIDKNGNT